MFVFSQQKNVLSPSSERASTLVSGLLLGLVKKNKLKKAQVLTDFDFSPSCFVN